MPLLVIAGALYAGRNVLASQQSVPAWIVWTLVSVGAVIAMALLCACGHFVIRAFEMGRPENQKV
jgi:membrane protein DedA with SNARE-associated domain